MITYGMLVDAIKKNGYEQGFDIYVNERNNEVLNACALGQGFLNLKKEFPDALPKYAFEFYEEGDFMPTDASNDRYYVFDNNFIKDVVTLNDTDHLPIPEIVAIIRKNYAALLDQEIPVRLWSDWEPSDAQMGY